MRVNRAAESTPNSMRLKTQNGKSKYTFFSAVGGQTKIRKKKRSTRQYLLLLNDERQKKRFKETNCVTRS